MTAKCSPHAQDGGIFTIDTVAVISAVDAARSQLTQRLLQGQRAALETGIPVFTH